jgi:hypothetical protein
VEGSEDTTLTCGVQVGLENENPYEELLLSFMVGKDCEDDIFFFLK